MAVQKLKMPIAVKNKKLDPELKRLEKALLENETLMRKAAIKYEDLVAVKEDLCAAIIARKEARARNDGK
jgi:hypothetical protein